MEERGREGGREKESIQRDREGQGKRESEREKEI